MKPHVLIINGSLGGESGNTAYLLERLATFLRTNDGATGEVATSSLHLANIVASIDPSSWPQESIESALKKADGFVFASGTYWDSWGSPMQRFFERATEFEGSSHWLGKPAAALISMHSVGGKGVLSRMQGVLSSLGLLIPPMSGVVYSLSSQMALSSADRGTTDASARNADHAFNDDFWQIDDLEYLSLNLKACLEFSRKKPNLFAPWPVDRQDPKRLWVQKSK